jgi:hypothetical protein
MLKPNLYARVYLSRDEKDVYVLVYDYDGAYVATFEKEEFDKLMLFRKSIVFCGPKFIDAFKFIEDSEKKEAK